MHPLYSSRFPINPIVFAISTFVGGIVILLLVFGCLIGIDKSLWSSSWTYTEPRSSLKTSDITLKQQKNLTQTENFGLSGLGVNPSSTIELSLSRKEPQIREPQIREPQIREPQIRELQIRRNRGIVSFCSAANPTHCQDSDPVNQQTIEEIESIRQSLGGGLAEIFDDSPESNAQLQAIFTKQLETLLHNDPSLELSNQSRTEILPLAKPLQVANIKVESCDCIDQWKNQVEVRRKTAKLLEKAAAELEGIELYQDADLLREKANQLWQSARNKLESK